MKKYITWIFNLFILSITRVDSQPITAAKNQLLTAHQIEIIVDTACDKIKQGYVYASISRINIARKVNLVTFFKVENDSLPISFRQTLLIFVLLKMAFNGCIELIQPEHPI